MNEPRYVRGVSDVKRLLDEATPLPWSRSGPGPALVGDGHRAQFIAWTDASLQTVADFDLIVAAINHLPDYLAAVGALETCVEVFADSVAAGIHNSGPFCSLTDEGHAAIEKARAALARLRESVPTDGRSADRATP